jgi:hypothetical protein
VPLLFKVTSSCLRLVSRCQFPWSIDLLYVVLLSTYLISVYMVNAIIRIPVSYFSILSVSTAYLYLLHTCLPSLSVSHGLVVGIFLVKLSDWMFGIQIASPS